jgi:hypothetical protein
MKIELPSDNLPIGLLVFFILCAAIPSSLLAQPGPEGIEKAYIVARNVWEKSQLTGDWIHPQAMRVPAKSFSTEVGLQAVPMLRSKIEQDDNFAWNCLTELADDHQSALVTLEEVVQKHGLALQVTVLRPDRLRTLLHHQAGVTEQWMAYYLSWMAVIGDESTVRLLEERARGNDVSPREAVWLHEAANYIRARLLLPEKQQQQEITDETLFLQTYFGRPMTVDADSGSIQAVRTTVREGYRLSPEWIRRKLLGMRPTYCPSSQMNLMLIYFIREQNETSLQDLLEFAANGQLARDAIEKLLGATTKP